ncbi:DUF1697 domain-containing protein [Kineococcus gynurae]|uniref:DUF1697 domain-containing protein n=1 Tax=Kineococcus gynurae TaxID=452979 RepID=A0ABV5LW91_9ACTN
MLLRGINVGRHNRLAMADLRVLLADLGCRDVTTHLNSGNAVVTADPDGLAERVAAALPVRVPVVVFTAAELREAVENCPWSERARTSPKQVHVGYLDRPLSTKEVDRLGTRHGDDEVAVGRRVLYLSYAGPSTGSPLEAAFTRARTDVVLTTRNWSTATRLVDLTRSP